jgi:very-short-patch-repair endonuclease
LAAEFEGVDVALKPFSPRKRLLSKSELCFYEALRSAMYDHVVFAKVRLADLIDANKRHRSWQANFNRVCAKHIDFVVCDDNSQPVVAIELDDKSHARLDHATRDAGKDRLLQAAGLQLIRVPTQAAYDFEAIRKLVLDGRKPVDVNQAIWHD